MNFLVTGGAGLLGSEIIKLLMENQKGNVFALDIVENPVRLKNFEDKIEYIKADISEVSLTENILKKIKPDMVFHLGAVLGALSEEMIELAFNVNVYATFHLFKICAEAGVKQILFATSVSTYSMDIESDIINDDSLQRPVSFYGISKLFGEGIGLFFSRKKGIDFRAIRYPYIIGSNIEMRKGGILDYPATLIEKSLKGEKIEINVTEDLKIPIIYIKDAAKAIIKLGFAPNSSIKKRIYLVNGVYPTPTAKELVSGIKKFFPDANIIFKPDENIVNILKYFAKEIDDSNARKEWSWSPEYNTYEKIIESFIN